MAEEHRPPKTIDQLGEFALIERLLRQLRGPRSDTVLPPGDDVAAIDIGGERLLLATCDIQVAGTHFLPELCEPFKLGRKLLTINVSDIAAAGGRPTHALVSLLLPPAVEVGFLEELYRGLSEEAECRGVQVVGGNVSRGTQLAIDLFLLGSVESDRLLRRDSARVGDRLLVTGRFGAAAAGLEVVRAASGSGGPEWDEARAAFESPTARLAEALVLSESPGIGAVIDVSDGLAADVGHVCERSRVGVRLEVDKIPIAASALAVAQATGHDAVRWALSGGEDYELAFTARPECAALLASKIMERTGTPATIVGEMVEPSRGRRIVLSSRSGALT